MKRSYMTIFAVSAALCLWSPAGAFEASRADSSAVRSVFCEEDINRYPSTDIRLALNGVIPGLVVTEKSGMTGGMYGSESERCVMTSRGFTVAMFVDGMPVYPYEVQLDPEEIATVALVRDVVDKARFGARASDGVLFITTKRGQSSGRILNAWAESGVSVAGRMPEWVSGVDYANLQNQARSAAGYPVQYTDEDIEAFAGGRPDDLQHPNVDWRSLMFSRTKSYRKAGISVSGGSEAVKYALHLGYQGEGDIYRFGKDAGFNKANIRTNLDIKITETLKFRLGLSSNLSFRTSPVYGKVDTGQTNEFDRFISAANSIPPVAFPVHLGKNPENGGWVYGVSERYSSNPYAALAECGFTTMRSRSGIINATLAWDARKLLKGLRFESNVGFNIMNMDRIGKNPDYLAMIYDAKTGESLKTTHEGAKVSGKSNYGKWFHQSLLFD
ncbi:MAG: TonB-dependent receptor plug domain-containing protein, partial [Candidatus Cryptobacteroides sp.]